MKRARQAPSPVKGPTSYENWKAALAGQPECGASEYPVYTDAYITGEIRDGYGPYQLLNTVPGIEEPGVARASIVLRYAQHLDFTVPDMTRTDTDRYHGGSPPDEIAAVLALALGMRAKCGEETRVFDGSDVRGKPVSRTRVQPIILRGGSNPILPNLVGTRLLNNLLHLPRLAILSPVDVVALVRAARMYQDAIWIAESEPSLAWIMLVSAVEVVALRQRAQQEAPLQRLADSKPELVEMLESGCEHAVIERVAEILADQFGSTSRFVDFVLEFFPDAPSRRPPEPFQRSWTSRNFKKDLALVYGYRSKALHDGRPFPAPMCLRPYSENEWAAPSERPIAHAMAVGGGTWLAKDVPIQLHLFEYIVRGALLRWWQGLPTEQ